MPPRYLDLECSGCGAEVTDLFVMRIPEKVIHLECGAPFEQVYRPRRNQVAQLAEKDAIVVFRAADGRLRYPGRNDSVTPKGYERVELRTRAAVDQFCRANNVRHEATDFDKGSGRGHDDTFRDERYT